jgi:hypothetical protein
MMFLIPLGGPAHLTKAPDSWVLQEYKTFCPANNTGLDIRAVAQILLEAHAHVIGDAQRKAVDQMAELLHPDAQC